MQRKLTEPGFRYQYLKAVVVPTVDALARKLVRTGMELRQALSPGLH